MESTNSYSFLFFEIKEDATNNNQEEPETKNKDDNCDEKFFMLETYPFFIVPDYSKKPVPPNMKLIAAYLRPLTDLFGFYAQHARERFQDVITQFNNGTLSKSVFILQGYHEDSVFEMCESQFTPLNLKFRITVLPFQPDLTEFMESTVIYSCDGGARSVGLPLHCLVEVSDSSSFKKEEPLANPVTYDLVRRHYFDFFQSLYYYTVPIYEVNRNNQKESVLKMSLIKVK